MGGAISTVGGNGWWARGGDGGAATAAELYHPGGVAVDPAGTMYIADSGNNVVRQVAAGIITTVAGTGVAGGTPADGGLATSGNLSDPEDVTVDSGGVLYIADTGHHRIRRVAGGVITTVAGTGVAGSLMTGVAATTLLSSPYGIDTANGMVYVADTGNNRILMINGAAVSVIAGTGTAGTSPDGTAASLAKLNAPRDVKVDASGDIYVADTGNHLVRKISNGTISTVAGTGALGYAGDGALATAALLDQPDGLESDTAGNLYIADGNPAAAGYGGSVLRRVDRHGVIHTIAGKYQSYSWAGDGGSGTANAARVHTPGRMAIDATGTLYFPSSGELRVRQLTLQTSAAIFWTSNATLGATGAVYGWEFVSRTATPIASITVALPTATTGAGLYVVSAVHLPGTGTVSLSGTTLTYTLASPVTVPVGRHMYLSVAGFTNTGTAGGYGTTITTRAAGAATIDVSQSGAVTFTTATPVLVVPNPATTVTAPAQVVLYVDPITQGDNSVTAALTVKSNATNGYTLKVAGTPMSGTYGALTPVSGGLASPVTGGGFGAGRFGYAVSVSGAGTFAGTAGSYAGYTSAGEVAVTAGRPTAIGGDTVQITNRLKVDFQQRAGVYTGTLNFRVTGL